MRPLELKANMKFDLGEADDESECDLASSLHVLALPSWEPSRTPSIADVTFITFLLFFKEYPELK